MYTLDNIIIKYVELLAAMYTLDNIILKYVELLAAMYTLDRRDMYEMRCFSI